MAGVLYPARVVGTQVAHLARTEERKDDVPALFAICPGAVRMAELELIPADDEDQLAWCPDCSAYKHMVETDARPALSLGERMGMVEETRRIKRSLEIGRTRPTPAAPEGIWLEGGKQPIQGPV